VNIELSAAMSNANRTWGWHLAKNTEWLKLVLGGYSSFHDSAVRAFCLRRVRQAREDVSGVSLPEGRTRELLDLRLEVLHNRYSAPPVSDRPDYVAVLDFLDIRVSDIDVNGMVDEATILEMTLLEAPGELIQLDLTPNIGLDSVLRARKS
jgi:hypothetical protein